ncbi:MAG: cation:dicarboxylase symporter family transporter [Myxococcota bacterium]
MAKKRRLSLGTQILIALLVGIALGLFFGEYCAPARYVGQAFIGLLQMTVLPYIIVAIIANIGDLSFARARQLAAKAGAILLLFWAIGFLVIAVMPLGFPDLPSASFFSTSLLDAPKPIDFVRLYIPSNPFNSLANSLIPAVVLFTIAVGVALIGMREKSGLIEPLRILGSALMRINEFVIKLTPLGVLALAANAAGTMTIEEIGRLQAYLITYIAAALLLTFWILPMLVSALTPFTYRDVLRASRAPLLTAFAVNNVFVVLPMLISRAKTLFEQYDLGRDEAKSTIDVVLPVSFTFPYLGKLLALLFVLFAAWFVGQDLEPGRLIVFGVSGLLASFGDVYLAMPFLLDLMRLPADLFQLFVLAGVIIGRFGALTGAMHLLTLTLITTCAMTGMVSLKPRRLVSFLGATLVMLVVIVVATRVYLDQAMGEYDKSRVVAEMQLLEGGVAAEVLDEPAPNPVPLRPSQSRLERIRERGAIRIGFDREALPFSYINLRGELVGFDVELVHRLARAMSVEIEFISVPRNSFIDHLESDHIDIMIGGIPGSMELFERVLVSDAHLDVTPALMVPDHRRRRFDTYHEVSRMTELRLGVLGDEYIVTKIGRWLPNAEVVRLDNEERGAFLEGRRPDIDGLVTAAESASAWTLVYPRFAVVLSLTERPVRWPISFPIAGRDEKLAAFVNKWIDLKKKDGTIQQVYDHWILGRTAERKGPRWSIVRDVLHWVE